MINLTTNTKSFSVEKGTAGRKSGSGNSGSSTKIIKQIIYQGGGSGSDGGSSSVDVFTGATAVNAGRQGLVPQPLAGQDTLFLKGNGIWDKVFKNIREDGEGNIYIDGKATKFGSPIYLNDIFSNSTDPDENLRKIEFHDNVTVDSSLAVSGETRFSNNVIFNRNQSDGSGPNKVTVNANLEVNGKSDFTGDITANNIKVDNLTVNKLAHFFQLVIDEVKSSQGQIIISNAHAKIDYVDKEGPETMLWWRAEGEHFSDLPYFINNEFQEGDQILCQSFNRGQYTYDSSSGKFAGEYKNKYYWVTVRQVLTNVARTVPNIDGTPGEVHAYNCVIINNDDTVSPKDGEFLPEIGDEIVQLGNRSDTTRQAAIIISAYYNAYLDKEIKAPAIVQYDGINDFDLKSHRLNVISKGINRFLGSYLTPDGKTDIVDKIDNIETTTSNRFSEIQQTIDGITSTVSNNTTKIDTLTGKVTENATNISKLDQKADQIHASVTQNSSVIDTLTGKVTTNTENISKLQVKADGISSTVELNTLKIDSLTGKVDRNTKNISKIDYKADSIQSTVTRIEGDYVTSSQLTQTSQDILAQVSNTYIKIEDGRVIINAAVDEKTGEIRDDIDSIKRGNIELNGNTTINGNLTVQNATDGLTLVGNGGTTQIRSKNIGNFFDYIKNPTQYWLMKETTNGPGMMMYQDGSVNKEKFVNDNDDANQTIQIPTNTKVSFTGAAVVFVQQSLKNMGFIPRVTRDPENLNRYKINVPDNSLTFIQFIVKKFEMIWTFINKDTGAVIKTFTNVDHGEFSVTEAVPNCKIRCQVYAYIDEWEVWQESFSYNGKNYTLGSNSKADLNKWAALIGLTNFTLTSQDPTVNNLIGYNGQAYNFGGGNGMFIGKTGLQAKFGDYTFMINPSTIINNTESGREVFREGIWSVNKYRFTTPQGPFADFETSKSQFLTQGRGFGVKNVRAPGTSGKILVLPEDDIIMVSEFSFVSGNIGNIDIEIYFPPCNETTFIGHEITIMQIHMPNSPTTSTCKIFTTDNRYQLYKQDGTSFTSYTFGYETRTFIPNFLMGRWVML